MRIQNLSLTNFRCFRRAEIDFSDGLNLFFGNNAQGKTSILEAIHFVSLLTSSLAGNDRELINFDTLNDPQPFCRILVNIEKERISQRVEIRLILGHTRGNSSRLTKEVFVDGVKKRLYDAVGIFNSVLFLPQMTRIIEGGPDERRKYLDQTLSQAYPQYVRALSDYQKGIIKRNALLKRLWKSGGDKRQLVYWDHIIAEKGALIISIRQNAVRELDILIRGKHSELTTGNEDLSIHYSPSLKFFHHTRNQLNLPEENDAFSDWSTEGIQDHFLSELERLRDEEIQRGFTTVGPHRDDVIFKLGAIDLGVYGSRGQIRSTIMSLKFAETLWLNQKTSEKPVLLLDETLAELDRKRRNGLMNILNNHSQAVLTTADLELFPADLIDRSKVWSVSQGKISIFQKKDLK